jgi:hypothetical protein
MATRKKPPRLFASIDIGTNSVLLLIAELKKNENDGSIRFETIREEQQIPRLGKGVDARKTLAKESYPLFFFLLQVCGCGYRSFDNNDDGDDGGGDDDDGDGCSTDSFLLDSFTFCLRKESNE